MQINFQKSDDLQATLSLHLTPEDYKPELEKELKKYQQKMQVKGFRPGKAPMGLVKKEYGKSIYAEVINQMISDKMFGYLKENNIEILGQPLESTEKESKVNFDTEEDFEFNFDLGISPTFEVNISDADVLTRYNINATEDDVKKEFENIQRRNATIHDSETSEENDIIYVTATELGDNNETLEGGVAEKKISITPANVKNEDIKKSLLGLTVGAELILNLKEVYNNNEAAISNTLGIQKEAVNDLNDAFSVKVEEIKRYIDAPLDEELFTKTFGEDVTTLEQFTEKVKDSLAAYFLQEAENHIEHNIGHLITEKHEIALPDTFLKRWLQQINKEQYNADNIDEVYVKERNSLIYSIVQDKIAAKYDVHVHDADVKNAAIGYTYNMFMNYGLHNVGMEMIQDYAMKELAKEEFRRRMVDIALNRNVIQKIKEIITIQEEEIDSEDFYKKLEAHHHDHHAA